MYMGMRMRAQCHCKQLSSSVWLSKIAISHPKRWSKNSNAQTHISHLLGSTRYPRGGPVLSLLSYLSQHLTPTPVSIHFLECALRRLPPLPEMELASISDGESGKPTRSVRTRSASTPSATLPNIPSKCHRTSSNPTLIAILCVWTTTLVDNPVKSPRSRGSSSVYV